MDSAEFRVKGKEMVDYICDYLDGLGSRRVTPNVEPGYLRRLLPGEAPQQPEEWDSIMRDVDDKIMPGVTHWQHPRFNAYFPSGNSFPSILGDMLSDAIGCIGFSWAASPACSELENIVMDWFGRAIGLPDEFLSSGKNSKGGGAIEASASDCILVSMLAARAQVIRYLKEDQPDAEDSVFLPKLVAYCSREAHSCVEKAAMICMVKLRVLDPDDKCSLRGATLRKAMEEDEAEGLVPFFVSCTLGSTGSCSFDNLVEVGPVCRSFPCVWMHVDGAYGGNAFICPELRPLMAGIHFADSFNTNPNKWLLVSFDCSCLWVRDRIRLTSALVVDPLYLQHDHSDEAIDYRHWGIQLSRRFRSLKLWFVIRRYGIAGLQAYIRNHIRLAKAFEELVRKDDRFEVHNDVRLGLVCFRLKGTDRLNQDLLASINGSGKLHMIPSLVRGKYIIRYCVVAEHASDADIDHAWEVIQKHATELLEPSVEKDVPVPVKAAPVIPTKPDPSQRRLSRRLSFTRSVSREVFKRSMSRSSLHDGATPIIVPDDEDNINSDLEEDVFSSSCTIEDDRLAIVEEKE
ncbi:hypothetical protein R5R35_008019 [Gryllus longicercus]|uniref:Tyrosine decarboxylase n=1 Tax=Gryllus longicercus TaxID=2509291 RepID=A0AAN9VCS5_9ORTH